MAGSTLLYRRSSPSDDPELVEVLVPSLPWCPARGDIHPGTSLVTLPFDREGVLWESTVWLAGVESPRGVNIGWWAGDFPLPANCARLSIAICSIGLSEPCFCLFDLGRLLCFSTHDLVLERPCSSPSSSWASLSCCRPLDMKQNLLG